MHACLPQPGEVLGERCVVDVTGVRLGGCHDRAWSDEAGDVVDMSMGVVACDTSAQPDDRIHAEMVVEHTFHVVPSQARVADLHHRIEQAFLGRQSGTLPVDVDAAPFEYDAAPATRASGEPAQAQGARNPCRQPVVV